MTKPFQFVSIRLKMHQTAQIRYGMQMKKGKLRNIFARFLYDHAITHVLSGHVRIIEINWWMGDLGLPTLIVSHIYTIVSTVTILALSANKASNLSVRCAWSAQKPTAHSGVHSALSLARTL